MRLLSHIRVRQLLDPVERSALCDVILRSLPEWFGIESAIDEYVRETARLPTFVGSFDGEEEQRAAGFLSLKLHNPYSAEIYVMAVRREAHGRGVGTALVAAAESFLNERSIEYLQVKTLGPSRPSSNYAATRAFYEAKGFRPLEELHGLWEGNPCLIMVKRLPADGG